MKNNYLIIAMLLGVVVSTVACSKCVTCTKDNATDQEICKKDYNGSKQAYDAAVAIQENFGYNCK